MKVQYVAEDGTVFSNINACRIYESGRGFKMCDCEGNPLTASECPPMIFIGEGAAVNVVRTMFNQIGQADVVEEITNVGIYVYSIWNDRYEAWDDIRELYEAYKEPVEVMDEPVYHYGSEEDLMMDMIERLHTEKEREERYEW